MFNFNIVHYQQGVLEANSVGGNNMRQIDYPSLGITRQIEYVVGKVKGISEKVFCMLLV